MSSDERDTEEKRINQIAQLYALQYWREENEGKLPNIGLIIRDALIEYRRQSK